MQQFKITFQPFLIIILIITLLPCAARSQSGRGRPRVPTRESTAPAAPPVNVPASTAVVGQEQTGNVSRFLLRNGMTVIISEQHAAPIAAAVAYFKVGHLDEPDTMVGVARLIERAMLAGNRARPAGRTTVDARALGGLMSVDTSHEGTGFQLVVSSEKIKDALAIQADILQKPALAADELRRAAPLVIEQEKLFPAASPHNQQSEAKLMASIASDDPAAYAMARLHNLAFDRHRLGRWRPASLEALRSITPEQVAEFYQAHYTPENLIVVVVGDVSTFNTLVEIQRLYGDFKPAEASKPATTSPADPNPSSDKTGKRKMVQVEVGGTGRTTRPAQSSKPVTTAQPKDSQQATEPRSSPSTTAPAEPEQTMLRYGADRGDITQSIVSVGFHVPGLDSKDWAAIEVLAALLGQGRGSRLHRALIDAQPVVSRAESNYLALTGAGLLTIQMSLPASVIDKAEALFFTEMERFRREIPAEGDLSRAKLLLEKRLLDRTDTYLGQARMLAHAGAARGGLRAISDYRGRIRQVRAEDVQRLAAKYLTIVNTSVHEYEPFTAAERTFNAERFIATVAAWAPSFAAAVNPKEVFAADSNFAPAVAPQGPERSIEQQDAIESVQPLPVRDFSTLNGPQAYVREDHSLPKTAVALLFQGGRDIEDQNNSGSTELMLRTMLYGMAQRAGKGNAFSWAQELEQLGAEVEVVVEPDFYGFVLSVLSRNADRALRLLRRAVEDPNFRDEDINRARVEQLGLIREARDSQIARSRELLFQALFPGHPYSLPIHGRDEIVSKLTSDQISAWHAQTVKRQIPLAIIVGDTDGSALVSGSIAEGFKRREVDRSLPIKIPPPPKPAEKTEQQRSPYTTASVGVAGPKRTSDDQIVIELIESLMNGPGGRLLTELRDKQGIVTEAELISEAMFTAGAIYAYLITSPENEQRARAGLLAEMERLARDGASADEVASARAVAAGLRLALLQSHEARAIEYARAVLYQRPATEVDTFAERVATITSDQIKRAAAAYLKAAAASAGVVRGAQLPAPPSSPKQD